MTCEHCSLKCIASDCDCLCHEHDELCREIINYCNKAKIKGSFNYRYEEKLVSFEIKNTDSKNKEMKAKDFSKAIDKSGLRGFQFKEKKKEVVKK